MIEDTSRLLVSDALKDQLDETIDSMVDEHVAVAIGTVMNGAELPIVGSLYSIMKKEGEIEIEARVPLHDALRAIKPEFVVEIKTVELFLGSDEIMKYEGDLKNNGIRVASIDSKSHICTIIINIRT